MMRTTGFPNANLAQRGDRRCATVTPQSEILRTSSALTRPQRALRTAITIASVVALMSVGTAPVTAEDGDTVEESLVDELSSDAASDYARDAKEGLDERQESNTRQQNRADQESRGDGSIQERQEERAREEIKDAVTEAYLSGKDGSEAARDAASDDSSSDNDEDKKNQDDTAAGDEGDATFDVAVPKAKPTPGSDADINETGTAGATDGIELGLGAYPGVGPDIYGAEVVGRLANQVLPSGPMAEAGNPTGELGAYGAVPGLGQQDGSRIGAGYGGIFGSLAGVKAPSASESGRMQGDGSDGIPAREMGDHIIIYDDEGHEGHVVQTVEKDDLDAVTGSDGDWHIDGAGELKITWSENSGSGSDQTGGSDENEETMEFGADEAVGENSNDNDSESDQEGRNEGNSESASNSESSSNNDNEESSSESESNSESSSEDGQEEENKTAKDDGDTLPCRPGLSSCGSSADPEELQEEVKRASSHSRTTMPANPGDGEKVNFDLPWNILNQLDKTTMPVRPGSMQQSAMPLPLSVWNPGYIDPHRGN
ncbi:hypothetical protein ACFOW6_05360 [Fodinicurvata halophila]|uniref:Uncharacterized protein n=1 Tax=Fodinicurvata halophila TaxID=1419723 RepID=A0ABV8UK27_9PROT